MISSVWGSQRNQRCFGRKIEAATCLACFPASSLSFDPRQLCLFLSGRVATFQFDIMSRKPELQVEMFEMA